MAVALTADDFRPPRLPDLAESYGVAIDARHGERHLAIPIFVPLVIPAALVRSFHLA
jgi:hypothetical protein